MPNPIDPIVLPADLEFDAFFTFSLSYLNLAYLNLSEFLL